MEQPKHLEIRQLKPPATSAVHTLGTFLASATFGSTETLAVKACTDPKLQDHLRPVLRLLVDGLSPCAIYRVNNRIDGHAKSDLTSSSPAWLVPCRISGRPTVDGIPLEPGSAIYTDAPVIWEPGVDVIILLPPRILI